MDGISIVIADQRKVSRRVYAKRLVPQSGMRVVAEAATSYEVIKALRHKPHVLLLDWKISAMHGLSLLPLVRHQSPHTRVILIAEHLPRTKALEALALGARGYLTRKGAPGVIAKAVRLVDQGEAWVPRKIVPPVVDALIQIK